MKYIINEIVAPRTWDKFKKWHPAACSVTIDGKDVMKDPMTSEERYDYLCSVWKEKKMEYEPRSKVSKQ